MQHLDRSILEVSCDKPVRPVVNAFRAHHVSDFIRAYEPAPDMCASSRAGGPIFQQLDRESRPHVGVSLAAIIDTHLHARLRERDALAAQAARAEQFLQVAHQRR